MRSSRGTIRRLARSVRVLDAPDVVAMHESPLSALRRKRRSSIRVAADSVAAGDASAIFSAGHSGATVLAAHAAFGVLPGVDRPALAVTMPTLAGAAVLLDAGANLECRPDHLVQFATMGSAYAAASLVVDRPRVALLSIGEEADKGNDLIREAHARLRTVRPELHRQHRGARAVHRPRRRDRVRRFHGQRRAQGR